MRIGIDVAAIQASLWVKVAIFLLALPFASCDADAAVNSTKQVGLPSEDTNACDSHLSPVKAGLPVADQVAAASGVKEKRSESLLLEPVR